MQPAFHRGHPACRGSWSCGYRYAATYLAPSSDRPFPCSRARCLSCAAGCEDRSAHSASCREGLAGIAPGVARRANGGAETEDERIQHPYAQLHASGASNILRGVGSDCTFLARAYRSRAGEALSIGRSWVGELPRISRSGPNFSSSRNYPSVHLNITSSLRRGIDPAFPENRSSNYRAMLLLQSRVELDEHLRG